MRNGVCLKARVGPPTPSKIAVDPKNNRCHSILYTSRLAVNCGDDNKVPPPRAGVDLNLKETVTTPDGGEML